MQSSARKSSNNWLSGGFDFQQLAFAGAARPDADPFDLLCHLAFNAPVLTAFNAPTE